jgi:hypothetical protein
MNRFKCRCGQPVFFESTGCVSCGSTLGFDRDTLQLLAVNIQPDNTLVADDGRTWKACRNGIEFNACNWMIPSGSEQTYCWACRFNRTIPDQGRPNNNERLRRFESAKKRLFYTLIRLHLPLASGFDDPKEGLLLDFIEDQRSDPHRFPEAFVQTGFHGGVITINTLEADDDARESIRVQLKESYRTLLGHLRHESGHYYWSILDPDDSLRQRFKAVFGDPDPDYGDALAAYYANGPVFGWQENFISAYASAHPSEDWAETWAHYLLIYDALETAAAHGMVASSPDDLDIDDRVSDWRQLSVALNELNRSSGLGDVYPFVLHDRVADKLRFVHDTVRMLRLRTRAPEDC